LKCVFLANPFFSCSIWYTHRKPATLKGVESSSGYPILVCSTAELEGQPVLDFFPNVTQPAALLHTKNGKTFPQVFHSCGKQQSLLFD
jgi:hypothetical protein